MFRNLAVLLMDFVWQRYNTLEFVAIANSGDTLARDYTLDTRT